MTPAIQLLCHFKLTDGVYGLHGSQAHFAKRRGMLCKVRFGYGIMDRSKSL
ncbi:hypothetical protein SAMN06295998_107127 [Primorskyibacter flagellatus]|uniref:Uncharacterized protein n=1 Tax=Primorskyibacter flagellatus TaxID=1387277 RepID=A0A1W2CFR8_9RHOB|nr:hypothetical protein SAMN06295998_107127 [Primorskyibacter flagellatus]